MTNLTQDQIDMLRGECMTVCASAWAIDAGELAAWIDVLERQDAFGCFTDPTGWIQTSKSRAISLKMLKALAAFKRALEGKP